MDMIIAYMRGLLRCCLTGKGQCEKPRKARRQQIQTPALSAFNRLFRGCLQAQKQSKKLMKNFFVTCLTAIALTVSPVVVNAQNLSKSEKKEAQKAAKDMVKEGWKVQGLGTIEGNMLRLMERQAAGECLLSGTALDGYKSSNTALSNCQTQAINEYVKTSGEGIVRNRVTSEIANISDEESNNLVDMAEQNFIKELKGELGLPALKVVKGDPKQGNFQMQCWWMLSEKKLEQIRDKAIKQALADIDGASSVGDRISNFINGGSNVR